MTEHDKAITCIELGLAGLGAYMGNALQRQILASKAVGEGMSIKQWNTFTDWLNTTTIQDKGGLAVKHLRDSTWQDVLKDLKIRTLARATVPVNTGPVCAHGKRRFHEGCHDCDPHLYCEHNLALAHCQPCWKAYEARP